MSYPDLMTGAAEFHPVDGDLTADDPFTAVNYHFGMLLGVDDFETEFAYHHARDRLHQGWLHGSGVVWGLSVELDAERSEIKVQPGLAVDGAGRNLHLDATACLDPAAWYAVHEQDVTLKETAPEGAELAFDAHVTASFATCLTRPVPALAEPCAGAGSETAYSRIWETIDLRLVPGPAPSPADRHRRVRILLGLLAPEAGDDADGAAAAARAAVLATADADRAAAALAAFREMANADAAALAPAEQADGPRALTPADLETPVVLANIRDLALRREDGELVLADGTLDLLPRRSHIATETIQELTVAALAAAAAPPPAPPPGPEPPSPEPEPEPGPAPTTVVAVTLTANELTLRFSDVLDVRSIRSEAFAVSSLQAGGWVDVEFDEPPDYDAATLSVTLAFVSPPVVPWQVVVFGTGPTPLVDTGLQPIAGGRDFVHIERS